MTNKGSVDMLAGNDNNASSYREEIAEEDVTNSSELFRLEKFQFAGVHVIDDEESELVKVTPTPSFELPIFKDPNYKAPFNIEENEEDRRAYEIWKEQVERYYVERHSEGVIPFDRFTPEEQRIILGLDEEHESLEKPRKNKAKRSSEGGKQSAASKSIDHKGKSRPAVQKSSQESGLSDRPVEPASAQPSSSEPVTNSILDAQSKDDAPSIKASSEAAKAHVSKKYNPMMDD